MQTSDSTANIYKKLFKLKKALPHVKATAINPEHGNLYNPLEKTLELIEETLIENEIDIIQSPSGNGICTRIIDIASNEWIESTNDNVNIEFKSPDDYFAFLTRSRRAAIEGMLKLVIIKDNDGAKKQKPTQKKKERLTGLPLLTNAHPDYDGVVKSIQSGTQDVSMIKVYYKLDEETEKFLDHLAANAMVGGSV